jgi:hypothetical protein
MVGNSDGAGFAYDWNRQKEKENQEAKQKTKTLKKKIDKLTKKNHNLRPKR